MAWKKPFIPRVISIGNEPPQDPSWITSKIIEMKRPGLPNAIAMNIIRNMDVNENETAFTII